MLSPGDQVHCIKPSAFGNALTLGKVYTVVKHYHDDFDNTEMIKVVGDNGRLTGCYAWRFEKYIPKKKVVG